jgi:hypothetical protein
LTWSADPSVSQAVTWRTDTSVRKGIAQIAVADHGPQFEETAQSIESTTSELKTGLWTAHYNSASFNSLKPETLSLYDAFELHKQPGGINRLLDLIPEDASGSRR